MLNLRGNSFTESGIGEPEQDANSALTELDKGLRCGKIGEQCEAIVRFPRLFEKYPFPILINSSFLKLADVFRMGTNFLRLCVLRVCQQSEKHLDKISNVDEFVRRVFSVIHSNDPIARALTLRTLGAVAGIIPERQQVHHSIRRSLDSHDNVEIEAAIHAAIQFAEKSKTFAVSMCNKVSVMIQGQSTPANMKLQLIPILQYMHHDTDTAAMVRKLCLELLPSYPSEDFVLVTLNTLTQLASTTLVDIPNQVSLLLNYLHKDLRWRVKSKVLLHLHQLAKPGGHLWPPGAVDAIIDTAMECKQPKILSLTLDVLQCLVESPTMCYQHNRDSKLRQICAKNSYSPHPKIAAQSIKILTQILCNCYEKELEVEGTDAVISSLETFILLLTFSNEKYPYQLKLALKCAVQLCEVRQVYCETFVELLGSSLGKVDDDCTNLICEALGAIGSLQPTALLTQLHPILTLLSNLSHGADSSTHHTNTKVMLCTLVFQTLCGYQWNDDTKTVLNTVIASNNLWTNYRIARAAIRYSHHEFALEILNGLTERVSSEHLHFWLVCLRELCKGEAQLCATDAGCLVDRLDLAVVHYNKGIVALKAASTPTHNLQFQAEYMRIRAEFLQCLVQLIHSCNMMCIVPAPAIGQALVQSSRDEYQKNGYITNQIRKCCRDFKNCGELYWKLYQTAFDADPATLENIQILQQMCVLLENCVEFVCTAGVTIRSDLETFNIQSSRLESQLLIRGCKNAVQIAQIISAENTNQIITHKQMELLKKTVEALVNASLSIPRYFFQVLQSTSVKLAILSPQQRVLGEVISVQSGTQLTVKVEGVIQHGQRPGLFRTVEGVVVTVNSQLQSANRTKEIDQKNNVDTNSTLTQTVTPHRDFFTAQFLLAFPRGGTYLLTIEASVVDGECCTWKTGPRSTLMVRVPEEFRPLPINMPGLQASGNMYRNVEAAHPRPKL